jgi:hypothetical protein
MIELPEHDPATERWRELTASVAFLVRSLPRGNGFSYALQHFETARQEVETDALSLCIRDLRPYFAALVSDSLYDLQGTVRASQTNFSYLEGAYHGYHYLHTQLRLYHEQRFQGLPHIWRVITMNHIEGDGVYRDVLGYIRADIEKMRHPSTAHLRKDILLYLDRIRRSSLQNETRQQTIKACCLVLGAFH